MRRLSIALCLVLLSVSFSGCAYMKGGTDLSEVARKADLKNVTTGDGTFENYTATGHYTGTEVGIGIGIPLVTTLIELVPGRSNEQLLTDVAKTAQNDKAESLINVKPNSSLFTGIPFIFVGIYVDTAEGTGIASK